MQGAAFGKTGSLRSSDAAQHRQYRANLDRHERPFTVTCHRCGAARHSGLWLQVQNLADSELVACGLSGLLQAQLLLAQKNLASAAGLLLRCSQCRRSSH